MTSTWTVEAWLDSVRNGLVGLRELDPETATRLVYGCDHYGRLQFGMISPYPVGRPDLSRVVTVENGRRSDGSWMLLLTLDDAQFTDVFGRLCGHVYETVARATSARKGTDAALACLATWRELFRSSNQNRLGLEGCRGLYAELVFGFRVLAPAVGLSTALDAWEGPFGADQDFQIGNDRFEVKSVHPTARSVTIANEYQLAEGGALVCAAVSDAKVAEPGFESLGAVVEAIRSEILSSSSDIQSFDDALSELRYDVSDDYYRSVYLRLDSLSYFDIRPGFPRILPGDLPKGVGRVKYNIEWDAIEPFRVDETQAVPKIILGGE
ncbi:PD-(D/E)XK motif protein [Sinomonas halotolerans]|uniref:PD-(D/E)XK motif protein n=1 Tax=Sinomonas halotolerans TaxID=1644133 RepID=A0ABU9X1V2_9MICC